MLLLDSQGRRVLPRREEQEGLVFGPASFADDLPLISRQLGSDYTGFAHPCSCVDPTLVSKLSMAVYVLSWAHGATASAYSSWKSLCFLAESH